MDESGDLAPSPPPRRRSRRRSTRSRDSGRPPGLARRLLARHGRDALSLALLGAGVLLLVASRSARPLDLLAWVPHVWFVNRGILLTLGGLLALAGVASGALRLRWHINHRQAWWDRACPRCGHEELSRIHRSDLDRFIGRLGIPVRRYLCQECGWHGPRINDRRLVD